MTKIIDILMILLGILLSIVIWSYFDYVLDKRKARELHQISLDSIRSVDAGYFAALDSMKHSIYRSDLSPRYKSFYLRSYQIKYATENVSSEELGMLLVDMTRNMEELQDQINQLKQRK